MRVIELSPIHERPEDYQAIEKEIIKLFREEIYIPLLKELRAKSSALRNSTDDVVAAIASGQIQFIDGHFEGKFSTVLSRELRRIGATWDRKHGWWKIPRSKLSVDMRGAIGVSQSRFEQMADRVNRKLNDLSPDEIAGKLKLEKLFDNSIYRLNKTIESQLKRITIPPKFTTDQRERISREYTENMQLYIKDWTEKEIIELRNDLQKSAAQGIRYESLIKVIQDSYGVSQSKAKFLARQETSLLMTKIKQTRYQDAGVNDYKWRCVTGTTKHPVRLMHKELDGSTQSWQTPPIVNKKGERKNPGQDYGCRCVAIPIMRF